MNIDSYDWDELYNKAEQFITQYVHQAHINRGCKKIINGMPRVEITFPLKGNKSNIEKLQSVKNYRGLRGSNIGGERITRGEIVFNKKGGLN